MVPNSELAFLKTCVTFLQLSISSELVGSSATSWEDAVNNAIQRSSETLRDLRICEVVKLDTKIEEGKIVAYRARVQLSFKYGK